MSKPPNEERFVSLKVNEIITVTETGEPTSLDLGNEIKLYNEAKTNFTDMKYTGIDDREFDLSQIKTEIASGPPQIPPIAMTSPTLTTAGVTYTVTASNERAGGWDAWKVFNDINNVNGFQGWITDGNAYQGLDNINRGEWLDNYGTGLTSGYGGEWIQLETSVPVTMTDYQIWVRTDGAGGGDRLHPTTWRVFVSSDQVTWTPVHDIVNYNWGVNATQSFTVTTPTEGTYIRIVVNKVGENSSSNVNRNAVQMNGLEFTVTSSTCPLGCVHIDNELGVTGKCDIGTNLSVGGHVTTASADITGNLVVGSVLQDTAVDIYGSIAYTGADILLTAFVAGVPKEIVATPTSSVLSSTGITVAPPNTFALLLDTPGVYDISTSCAISPDQDGDTISLVIFADTTQIGTWSTRTLKMRNRFETVALSLIYQAAGSERISMRIVNTNTDDVSVNSLALKIVRLRTNV